MKNSLRKLRLTLGLAAALMTTVPAFASNESDQDNKMNNEKDCPEWVTEDSGQMIPLYVMESDVYTNEQGQKVAEFTVCGGQIVSTVEGSDTYTVKPTEFAVKAGVGKGGCQTLSRESQSGFEETFDEIFRIANKYEGKDRKIDRKLRRRINQTDFEI